MDKKIEKLLLDNWNKNVKEQKTELNENELLEILRESKEVSRELIDKHRHWNEYVYVVEIDNAFIGYNYAETTGDMSPWEVGYEFDPDSICEMEPIEVTITKYQRIKEK